MGFAEVYDYADGKVDWLAAGLPTEGSASELPRAGDVARDDVPTCRLDDRLGEVRERARAARLDSCVVVNDEGIVLGLLRREQLAGGGDDDPVERVMRPGPSTFRPNVPIDEMAHYMVEHDLVSSPVTSSDGRLIGLLVREDAVAAAHEQHGRNAGSS